MSEPDNNIKQHIDWSYWTSIPAWTLKEAVCLFLHLNPDTYMMGNEILVKSQEVKNLYRFFKRANQINEISSFNPPIELVNWAISRNIDIPNELIHLRAEPIDKYKEKYLKLKRRLKIKNRRIKQIREECASIDSVAPKRISSMYKVLYAMASQKYEYSPTRNSASKQISDDVVRTGIEYIGDETVRNLLEDAHTYLVRYGKFE